MRAQRAFPMLALDVRSPHARETLRRAIAEEKRRATARAAADEQKRRDDTAAAAERLALLAEAKAVIRGFTGPETRCELEHECLLENGHAGPCDLDAYL